MALLLEDVGEVVVGIGEARPQLNGFFNQRDGIVIMACLMRENTQEVQGIGMLGRCGQDLTVGGLGLGEAAGLMMLKGQCDCLIDHRVGHWVDYYSGPAGLLVLLF